MRRAAILITSLAILIIAGCNFYLGDDDGKNHHPQSGTPDGGFGGETPDAGCGGNHPGDPDGGFVPDGGTWYPDAGFWPDASPNW
jgi:hypothetical protein